MFFCFFPPFPRKIIGGTLYCRVCVFEVSSIFMKGLLFVSAGPSFQRVV